MQNLYQFKPEPPFSPGGEVAGVVKSIGEGVTDDFGDISTLLDPEVVEEIIDGRK